MAKLSKDEILKAVEGMTVLELADLVKALEEKFGVTAAPVAVAGAAAPAADAGEPKEEQTVFNVVLNEAVSNRIVAIKAVREIVPTLGLQEAKALVESAPKEVLTGTFTNSGNATRNRPADKAF